MPNIRKKTLINKSETMSTEVTENTQLEKLKSSAQKRFEAVSARASSLIDQCDAIEIKDETRLATVQQTMSEMRLISKAIDEKRKELKEPYLKTGKAIDALAKKITKPIDDAMDRAKNKLREWNRIQSEKAEAIAKENQKRKDFLCRLESQITEKMNTCATADAFNRLAASVEEKWPSDEAFGIYAEEATRAKNNFITLLNTKADLAIAAANAITAEDAETVAKKVDEAKATFKQIEEAKAEIEEKTQIANETSVNSKSSVRKSWKFEITEPDQIELRFLSPDEKKIRQFMADQKEVLSSKGLTRLELPGLSIYLDEAPVAR